MASVTGALLQLGRELRYRELPIIGKPVVIESLADVEHALRQLVTPWYPRDRVWDWVWGGTDIEGGLAKYGLLDRWCPCDAVHLEGGLAGIAALRATGFAADPELAADDRELAESFMVDLAESLGPPVIKLFLEDGLPMEDKFQHNRRRIEAGLPLELLPSYFPRGFVVTDACVTNAHAIWMGKHFYL